MRPPGDPKDFERRRFKALALLRKGMPGKKVAQKLGVSPAAISQWKTRYERAGTSALKAKPHPGKRPKLTIAQRRRLERMLLRGPRQHGYSTHRWTIKRIGELISKEFGVVYSGAGVWRMLHRMGWSRRTGLSTRRNGRVVGGWRPRLISEPSGKRQNSAG